MGDSGTKDSGAEDAGGKDASVDGGTADGGNKDDGGGSDSGSCASNCPVVEMVTVPSGTFQMGCNSSVDTECGGDENPYHAVNLSAFKIDKYEVTAGAYKACVTASVCTAASTTSGCNYDVPGQESNPINCVDWNQAKTYCQWAGKRLPTEAEWEKAARGTDGSKYPWGNTGLDCDHAVMSVSPCSNSSTAPVGSKPLGASPYGAEDMIGNVWEWVSDWYGSSYYSSSPTDNPTGPASGSGHVLRGGGWLGPSLAFDLRASNRYSRGPTYSYDDLGFRCAQ